MKVTRCLLVSLLTLAVCQSPATAQTIRGTVIDTITGSPAGRGFVVLLDETGRELARTLSLFDGRFTLNAPRPGIYRLRSERIGYRMWESQRFEMQGVTPYEVVLQIAALPSRLETLVMVGETSCRDPKGPFGWPSPTSAHT